ncbi:hypothetical protein ACFWNK_02015 [Streptomyces sp. NPDC058417]|uniref:hypothetical protein n=1 Tax=unclassified Streptomyces TaxID=2593676 RepID=UPI00365B6946
MNTRLVNSAAGVINAAMAQGRTAAGIALALESAGLLMSPETAAELDGYRRLAPQQCPAGEHTDWLVDSEFAHACPWCRIADLEAQREADHKTWQHDLATARSERDARDARMPLAELLGLPVAWPPEASETDGGS